MMTKFSLNSKCYLDLTLNNLKPELIQATDILNVTMMAYENMKSVNKWGRFSNDKKRTICHLRGHNSTVMTLIKFHFFHAHAQCMSELCSKF